MTTGRINQVTIVRRKRPPAPLRAPESFQVTDRTQKGAPRCRGLGVSARGPQRAIQFPTPNSPGHPSATRDLREEACGLGAPRGGPDAAHLPWRCQRCAVTPRCSVICVANGQAPTEPILQRRWYRTSAASGYPSVAVPPAAGVRGRVREGRQSTMEARDSTLRAARDAT